MSSSAGRGYAAAVAAYATWGLLPVFWQLMDPAGAVEILAHRIAWTMVAMAVVMTVVRRWAALRRLPTRTWGLIATAAVLVAVNWGVYIWAAGNGRVVDSALGYYIQPLFVVLLGVLVLGERLRRLQWVAVGVATVAVVVIAVGAGTLPWVGVALAVSFGLYGLIKKTVPLDPVPGLAAEGLVLGPLAVGYLVVLQVAGVGTAVDHGPGHALLLIATGPATALPLLLFAVGAKRLPLVTLGVLQYLNPTLQFVVGAVAQGEPMPASRWVGFALVWSALLVFTVDALLARRPAPTRADEGSRAARDEPCGSVVSARLASRSARRCSRGGRRGRRGPGRAAGR